MRNKRVIAGSCIQIPHPPPDPSNWVDERRGPTLGNGQAPQLPVDAPDVFWCQRPRKRSSSGQRSAMRGCHARSEAAGAIGAGRRLRLWLILEAPVAFLGVHASGLLSGDGGSDAKWL